ncbi:GOLPH3/VPS74 family protein [Salinicoccus sp. HZC-1]|uniref:GOLPH3/VPS74 family protein n=1 Tax=Salinicoccus sp. HZC-1 TaxID=3385497 RepID=UPI00398BABD4
MFTIAEELLLLAMDDDKGTVVPTAGSLEYGLAGAILSELTMMERIGLKDDKITVVNSDSTDVSFLDSALNEIKGCEKAKEVEHWINHFGDKMGELKKDIIKTLVDKGVLKEEEKKVLWVFNQTTYPTAYNRPEREIRDRVQKIVFDDAKPDAKTAMLLSLIQTCTLVYEVFGKDQEKEASMRLEKIVEDSNYSEAVKKSIEEMETAILIACNTVIMTTVINTPNN